MMKRFHLYKTILSCRTLLATVCLLATGCTGSMVEDVVPDEAQPVELSFSRPDLGLTVVTAGGSSTKAQVRADGDPTALPEGATVRIAAYLIGRLGETVTNPADFSTVTPNFQATYVVGADGSLSPCLVDNEGKKIEGTAKGMFVRSGKYDFYAISPARPITNVGGTNQITNIPHKEDVMASCARTVTISKSSSTVTLQTFKRKCSLVVFNVACDASSAVSMISLRGTALKLSSISKSGANLVAGESEEISKTGSEATDAGTVSFVESDFQAVDPASDPDNLGLNKVIGIVLPKDGTPFNVAVAVERDGNSVNLGATVNKNITFDSGKRYVFTLQVKNDVSKLLMRVMDWNTISFTDDNVGGADPGNPNPSDPDINEGIGVGIVIAEWTNIDWSGNGNVG
ncbi:BF2992 family fimbrillin-A clan protein [Parabacteroides chinchillae]